MAGFRIVSVEQRCSDGTIYSQVVDEASGDIAALRLLPGADPDRAARFLQDAKVLAELAHPSLPAVRALGDSPLGAYVVSEELPGRSIVALLERNLPAAQATRMLEDVAEGLDLAHAAGLLHRRIRPETVVAGEWLIVRPLLVDFALGADPDGAAPVDAAQAPYAAPEELRGGRVGPAADRYSLACMLYERFTGAPPFGRAPDEAIEGHLSEPPPAAARVRSELHGAVDRVFRRALAKDPGERHESAAELVHELARAAFEGIEPEPWEPSAHPFDVEPERVERTKSRPESPAAPPRPAGGETGEFDVESAFEDSQRDVPAAAEAERDSRPEAAAMPAPTRRRAAEPAPEPDRAPEATRASEPDDAPERDCAPRPAVKRERKPGHEPRRKRRRPLPLGVALVVVAAAGAGGLVVGWRAGDDGSAPERVSAGPVELQIPDGWRRSRSVPTIGELAFDRAVVVGAAQGGGLVAGVIPDGRDVLDPRRVAARVGELPPRPKVVRIGGYEAYRWSRLRARNGGRRVVLHVLPTSSGVVTLACHGRAATGARADACGRVASGARLRGARPYSPLAGDRWRERVGEVVGRLRGRRSAGLRSLFEALDDRGQARAADSLARAHRVAIADLGARGGPPQAAGPQRRVVASIKALERAYRALALAVRRRDQGAFTAAVEAIRRADARLRRELRSI